MLKKPAEEVKQDEVKPAAEAKEALKRWQRVEVDEQLYNLVEQKDGVYVGKPTLGMAGIEAAKAINQAMKERSRRADILTNDPLAALDEAGVTVEETGDETRQEHRGAEAANIGMR